MKQLRLLVIVLLFANLIFAAKVVPLIGHYRPFFVKVDDARLYISDGPTVSVYSLDGFKLIKKFGKEGEGPQEFELTHRNARGVMISLTGEGDILVNSQNKVSFFTTDGEFISETKTNNAGLRFQLIENNKYIGEGYHRTDAVFSEIRNLYDADFIRGKELYRRKAFFQPKGKNLNPFFLISPIVEVYKKQIYINGVDNEIYVFDSDGNKVRTITHQYEKLVVTQNDKDRIIHWYKTYLHMKDNYHLIKGRIGFPKYFPGIRMFNVADDKVYVLTYKKKDNMSEFVILDLEGNFLEKKMVPFREKDERVWCPYTIKNNSLYQLVENEVEEEWVLHITGLD